MKHLTTVIPYNHEIVYSVQQLQILNKCKLFEIKMLNYFNKKLFQKMFLFSSAKSNQ